MLRSLSLALILTWVIRPAIAQPAAPLRPIDVPGLAYTNAFFPGADHDPTIPTPESLLSFSIGQRAANTQEIERCLKAWTNAAPGRTRLIEYARSHEDRPLHAFVVTSPRNRARLDEIQAGYLRLGDPRGLEPADAAKLTESLPGVAWLAYCIHGDETEGSDAALAVIHHLLADRRPETARLLDDLVVILDPVQNPDGRDRYLKMVAENRAATPNLDQQSLLHAGYWPRGRVNHYLFDMNRDWIFGTQPETRGRLREVARWNPLLFVDLHGMSGESTYLFSPPREPINRHQPAGRSAWERMFARNQARAFDAQGWVYYTGEWNEGWYPGYSDSWSVFRGAVGILCEVASIAQDGVRQSDGRIQSHRESIHQHIVSSMSLLATLQTNAPARLREFAGERRANLEGTTGGPGAPASAEPRTWAILPTANRSRLAAFIDTLRVQSIQVHQLTSAFTAAIAVDQLGRTVTNRPLPPGTVLVSARQATAPLVRAVLEFDPRMRAAALEDERREILRNEMSRIYDITSWNLTMLFGLEAFALPQDLPSDVRLHPEPSPAPDATAAAATPAPANPVAWILDGADDASVAAAGRLMERGFVVRAAEKPFELDGRSFARGSVVVTRFDNRRAIAALADAVRQTAGELKLEAVPVGTGLCDGDLPDLGGDYFRLLIPPQIAIVGRGRVSAYDFGSIWHLLDQQLNLRHSHLIDEESAPELARYNVIVIPDRDGELPASWREPFKEWVKAGGTLIAIGNAAGDLASRTNELTKVRLLPDVLGRLPEYEQRIFREWLAQTAPAPVESDVWTNTVPPAGMPPWPAAGEPPKEDELKKQDAWNAMFMPQGAILAARTDPKHWLTFGTIDPLPVLAQRQPVLMSAGGIETPARFGVLTPGSPKSPAPAPAADAVKPAAEVRKGTDKDSDAPKLLRPGWSAVPEGTTLHLRMSGLLWPEAAQRFANSAVITRERLGRGQVILFAGSPNFRAATRGTARLLANAIVYGPGFGTVPTVKP